MTTGFLTLPFSTLKPHDPVDIYAVAVERGQRELLYRDHLRHENVLFSERSIFEVIPARDAGDVCHVCGSLVTWVDHLPPRDPDGSVRCFTNVRTLLPAGELTIDDIFRRV